MRKEESQTPVLYSFRRCPYAMRARVTLCLLDLSIEIREVSLKNKPQSMLAFSPKGTVPVMVLEGGKVIDESWDIMLWATQYDREQVLYPPKQAIQAEIDAWVHENDVQFKPNLDRFKYPNRFDNAAPQQAQAHCEAFFQRLNGALANTQCLIGDTPTLADIAVFPFVRQATRVDEAWFNALDVPHLRAWLKAWLTHPAFERAMQKFPLWQEGETFTL